MRSSKLVLILVVLVFLKLLLAGYYLFWQRGPSRVMATESKSNPFSACPPEIFESIRVEEEKLEKKRKELELKEARLKLLEKQIERRLSALLELESSVEKKLKRIETIETERFNLLVKAYSEMRPSKAASLLMNMEPEMAIKILSVMKSDQIAKILASMPPEKAAEMAEALSGYAPKEF